MLRKLTSSSWIGGIGPYEKVASDTLFPNSTGRLVKYLDPHEDINYLTQQKTTSKVSGSTVTNLVRWICDGSPFDTNRYFYGGTKLYRETSAGTWSTLVTNAASGYDLNGQGMLVYDNYVYQANAIDFDRWGKLDGTPSSQLGYFTSTTTGTYDVDEDNTTASGATYTLPSAISETATNRQTLNVSHDPLRTITLFSTTKGTGDWTVTVHDRLNNVVGTATLANANVSNASTNTFTFGTVGSGDGIRITIGAAYHFHVTSSNGTGTLQTSTASDLETSYFLSTFTPLVYDSQYHPMKLHLNMMCTGNERYLCTWDGAVLEPNRLIFAPGYKVRTLTIWREYLVIGCWMGNTIEQVENGRLYFWDGISDRYNFYKDVTVGIPNALHNSQDRLLGVYGIEGSMYMGSEPFQRLQDLPYLSPTKQLEVYPGAITEWQGQTFIGTGATDDTDFNMGVYQYGSRIENITDSLLLAFPISTGTINSTSVNIGAVAAFGSDMYVSWNDNGTYGVDKISRSNTVSATGSWESLIFDNGNAAKSKLALRIAIEFLPLTTGQSVTIKYRKDRAASFTNTTTQSTVGATRVQYTFANSRFKEFEYGFDIASSSNTNVYITSVVFEFDDLAEEVDTN